MTYTVTIPAITITLTDADRVVRGVATIVKDNVTYVATDVLPQYRWTDSGSLFTRGLVDTVLRQYLHHNTQL